MLQDVVEAKQDELNSSVKRRESKLRQLFRITTRYGGHYTEKDELLFLQENNIEEGRYFNPSTLPTFRLHVQQVSQSQPAEPCTAPSAEEHNEELSSPTSPGPYGPEEKHVTGTGQWDQGVRSLGASSDAHELSAVRDGIQIVSEEVSQLELALGNRPDDLVLAEQGQDTDVVRTACTIRSESSLCAQGPSLDPSEVQPLSSGEAAVLPLSSVKTVAALQRPTPAASVHLPANEVQEQRSNTIQQDERKNQVDTEDACSLSDHIAVPAPQKEANTCLIGEVVQQPPNDQTKRHLRVAQDEDPLAYGDNQETFSGAPHVHSILRSQMDIVRADNAFAGTPSTPDEQLRLEEAQALQHSRMIPAVPKDIEKHESQGQVAITAQNGGLFRSLDDQRAEQQATGAFSTSFGGMNARDSNPSEARAEPDAASATATPGLRENTFPGMTGSLSKDLTFSRRPPMRIDTGVPSMSESSRSITSRKTATPAAGTPFTPSEIIPAVKSGPPTSQVHSPPERMTTRVSSGALRHKSVSEILGETPRHSNLHSEKALTERATHADENGFHTPRSAVSITSPDAVSFKQRLNRLEEKDKSKLSTVVFVRQPSASGYRHGEPVVSQDGEHGSRSSESKDYLLPLFAAQAVVPPQAQQLHSLVLSAHKTLATADHLTDFQEQQDKYTLTRIYQLQSANKWSLRQHERSVEPCRPKTHWDVLMGQMRWMRTDFREERKWKLAAAKGLADACSQWVASSAEERALLQIKVRSSSVSIDPATQYMQTPELIPSREDDSSDVTDFESPDFEASKRSAPARIFSLPPDMFVFGLDQTPIADKILSELPLYQPSMQMQDTALQPDSEIPDDAWRSRVVPFSKFVEGKMITREQGPPRKKSRYDYFDDQGDNADGSFDGASQQEIGKLEPVENGVALFRQENKHIRDRIHAGHAFRPPSEFLMPPQSFFESRQSSQWTQSEDDDLRRLVRESAYNWSLISSCLSTRSLFSSGAERRTPWECFERWVGLEGLPSEMSKTQYFKAYHSRLQAPAQRNHEAQQPALQQHQGSNAAQTPARRRPTLPVLVDHRKNNKHLHLIDAFRKLAKKRETAVHKQQHVANLAAMRKQNEANQPRTTMHTPQEFSRVKWEREQKSHEASRLYQQQINLQHREKTKMGQRLGQPNVAPNMMPRGPNYPPAGNGNGSSPNVASAMPNGNTQAAPMNPTRPVPGIPRMANGVQGINSVPSNSHGVPHASMQPQVPVQQRMPAQIMSDSARIYQEATRLQEQQRYLATQSQHQHPQPNGQAGNPTSPNMSRVNAMSHHNTSLFNGMQGRSGSPSVNGGPTPAGASTSPRMANPAQPQPLSNGTIPVINQIQNQVKARNPQASPEQINAMTTDTLSQYRMTHHAQVQAAMQAAAGTANATAASHNSGVVKGPSQSQQQVPMNGVNGRAMMNPMNHQEYAQMMRSQQSNQQSRSSSGGGINNGRTVSRSATPQTHPGHAHSQSPRP